MGYTAIDIGRDADLQTEYVYLGVWVELTMLGWCY